MMNTMFGRSASPDFDGARPPDGVVVGPIAERSRATRNARMASTATRRATETARQVGHDVLDGEPARYQPGCEGGDAINAGERQRRHHTSVIGPEGPRI